LPGRRGALAFVEGRSAADDRFAVVVVGSADVVVVVDADEGDVVTVAPALRMLAPQNMLPIATAANNSTVRRRAEIQVSEAET
jgi:hypothetical protein